MVPGRHSCDWHGTQLQLSGSKNIPLGQKIPEAFASIKLSTGTDGNLADVLTFALIRVPLFPTWTGVTGHTLAAVLSVVGPAGRQE